MFKISETKIDLSSIDAEKFSTKQIWDTLETNFAKTLPFLEETIEKWNSRTKLISNLSQTGGKKSTSVFNATIVEQVNSLLANEESRNRLIEKSHAKRDTYRVLGRGV